MHNKGILSRKGQTWRIIIPYPFNTDCWGKPIIPKDEVYDSFEDAIRSMKEQGLPKEFVTFRSNNGLQVDNAPWGWVNPRYGVAYCGPRYKFRGFRRKHRR